MRSGLADAAALTLVALALLRGLLSIGNYVTVAAGALSVSGLLGPFVGDLFAFWRLAPDAPHGYAKREDAVGPIAKQTLAARGARPCLLPRRRLAGAR